mmetsp:Transcript_25244/g.39396  ORF Transcript_25244/g.39396 Transcript_25244/m.39396 type:complete len:295 (-) Transcript_25244:59-943(-)
MRGDGYRPSRGSRGNGSRGGPGFGRGHGGSRGRGGRGGLGFKGGSKAVVVPHLRHPGIFIAKGKQDVLATLNMVEGVSVYGEKRVEVEVTGERGGSESQSAPAKKEYRMWNPYRSKLAAAIYNGIERVHIHPGTRVLYLGAASGTTVSHVSDIVGSTGIVYAVEFSQRVGRDLAEMSKKRPNIFPVIEDARHPWKYRMLVGMVDTIFMDVAQPDQARILSLNAQYFLKNDGNYIISIKANCIDSTLAPEVVFAKEVEQLKRDNLKPREQVTLEPFERDHAVVAGTFRSLKKEKK